MGKTPEHLAKSVFVEKLHARGYEVLLLSEPLDEILVQNIRRYKYVTIAPLCIWDPHWTTIGV
jgi:heat shock protein 90kDa beta